MGIKAQRRTRRDHSLWEKAINDQWGGLSPVLSPDESLAAAKKLYRHAMGRKGRRNWKWELTSGNRKTWPQYGTFYVNPDRQGRYNRERGLRDIIHLMSHYCHWKLHPLDKPHSIRQLRLEAKLTKFAIERKWHEGSLKKPEKPVAEKCVQVLDKVQVRYQRMVKRRDKYAKELDRAKRLLAKANSEVCAYERRHGSRLVA